MRDVMNVAESNPPAAARPRRKYPKKRTRKTPAFSVTSEEHQRVMRKALDNLEEQLGPTMRRRERTVLSWLRRRLGEAMQVQGRK